MADNSQALRRLDVVHGIKNGRASIDRMYEDTKHHGVIRGIAVMTKGFVKDSRGWEIDETTLSQIVDAGNKHVNLGVKARFGHPNMSSSALGTFLGRVKNFSVDGDIARADLFLSKSAYATPEGDLAGYVLNLAEEDPQAFGTSAVMGEFDLEKRTEKDAEGKALQPLLRIKSLQAVDAVDDPAANNGMFGKFFNTSVELSAKATEYLDKLLSDPQSLEYVVAFLERYRANSGREEINSSDKNKEDRRMTIAEVTQEQLQKERPELILGLQKEAVEGERSRCSKIVKSAHSEFTGMGMEGIVEEAVDSGKTVDAALASMRGKRLDDLKKEANKAPGADGDEPPVKLSHLDQAKKYREEHKCSMVEALRATAEPRKQA